MGWATRPTRSVMAEEKDCLEELQRIGLRISYFRRVKGMTQADLAEHVHINKNYLYSVSRAAAAEERDVPDEFGTGSHDAADG